MNENLEKNAWDENQLRNYAIKRKPVPKFRRGDPKIMEMITAGKPVIIIGSDFISSAYKWDLDYLTKNMGKANCTVIVSKDHNFKYYDEKRVNASHCENFTPPTKKVFMKIREFSKRMKHMSSSDDKMYLQQSLSQMIEPVIAMDLLMFKWDLINEIRDKTGWGSYTSNLLLIGMEGNVTPCHYDEQENLFAQARGYKRLLLFPPEQFECLYPHPVWHPHDRQSQVDFDHPDFERFPKFANAEAEEAIVGPGDVLYIPSYWWHHVESLLKGGYTVSVNFWFKAKPTGIIVYPLTSSQKMVIMRNVEKMLVDALRDPEEVAQLLRAIISGRY